MTRAQSPLLIMAPAENAPQVNWQWPRGEISTPPANRLKPPYTQADLMILGIPCLPSLKQRNKMTLLPFHTSCGHPFSIFFVTYIGLWGKGSIWEGDGPKTCSPLFLCYLLAPSGPCTRPGLCARRLGSSRAAGSGMVRLGAVRE